MSGHYFSTVTLKSGDGMGRRASGETPWQKREKKLKRLEKYLSKARVAFLCRASDFGRWSDCADLILQHLSIGR